MIFSLNFIMDFIRNDDGFMQRIFLWFRNCLRNSALPRFFLSFFQYLLEIFFPYFIKETPPWKRSEMPPRMFPQFSPRIPIKCEPWIHPVIPKDNSVDIYLEVFFIKIRIGNPLENPSKFLPVGFQKIF